MKAPARESLSTQFRALAGLQKNSWCFPMILLRSLIILEMRWHYNFSWLPNPVRGANELGVTISLTADCRVSAHSLASFHRLYLTVSLVISLTSPLGRVTMMDDTSDNTFWTIQATEHHSHLAKRLKSRKQHSRRAGGASVSDLNQGKAFKWVI